MEEREGGGGGGGGGEVVNIIIPMIMVMRHLGDLRLYLYNL